MLKKSRHNMIIDFLKQNGLCSTDDVSAKLSIPMTTLRRDLIELEHSGLINKLHGGVEYNTKSIVMEDFFEKKINDNVEEKIYLAKKAISLIKPYESIYLDSGSSGYYIAKFLPPELHLKIVTNSIYCVLELIKQKHQKVYLLGGKFKPVTGAIIGFEALQALENYNFDKAFIGVNAIDQKNNFYTTSSEHAQIKLAAIRKATKAYCIADASKFNKKSFYIFAQAQDVEILKK